MTWAPRGLIGVVHLPPMPGDPRYVGGGFDKVETSALQDAEAWVAGGVGALVIENFGSAPFVKGTAGDRLPPHQVAIMALLVRSLAGRFDVPVGVNCLRNDAYSAIAIAAASAASFVRVNVHVGAYVTDQGLVEGEAATTLRYRSLLGANDVRILADVRVKHATPLAPGSIESEVHDLVDRGLADAIVVTGSATGVAADAERLWSVRSTLGARRPIVLGSGLTPENARTVLPFCDAAIVGSYAKRGGVVTEAVDVQRVRELVGASRGCFRTPSRASELPPPP